MSTWSWFFVGIVVVLLIAMLLTRRAAAGVDPTQLLLDPDLVAKVRVLAQQDRKDAAIKMLRDGTPGLGLGSAKVMVDRMAAPRAATAPRVPAELRARARTLKDSGDVPGAVELIRSHLPDGRQAEQYVDGL